ncbi:hypothetical protein [Nonomuraea sp. SYSU D8015]|uniref:hypothetical protein n=1 Tax=Nonomuraea sp. SYSU D8015 TaxID=2593644 RepID=UPI001660699E|nr:hypothetical protein [Nonomuraea sp. SYSU D8015]
MSTSDRPPITGRSYMADVNGTNPQDIESKARQLAANAFGHHNVWIDPNYTIHERGDRVVPYKASLMVYEIAQEL